MDGYSECTYCDEYLTCMHLKIGKKCSKPNKQIKHNKFDDNEVGNKNIKQSSALNIDINLLELSDDGRLDITMK